MYKVKIYLSSGQVAEIITEYVSEDSFSDNLLEEIPEVRKYDPAEIPLITVEKLEG